MHLTEHYTDEIAIGSTLSDVHDDLDVCAESASSWYRANLLKGILDEDRGGDFA